MRDFHRHWHIRWELEDEHSPPRDPSQLEIVEQASMQASSTAWHQQDVKRRCIGYVGESRASSPEPPEPQPLEELIAKAMQPERTESVQGQESSELQEVSPEQWENASNSDKGKEAVKNKGGRRRRVTGDKVPGIPEHMTVRFQL